MTPDLTTLRHAVGAAASTLEGHKAVVRDLVRTVNAIGAYASTLQAAGQDALFEPVAPALAARLESLVQRTGYVNVRAGELANRLRELTQGLTDLHGDAVAVREALLEDDLAFVAGVIAHARTAHDAQCEAAPDVAVDPPGDGPESEEELG